MKNLLFFILLFTSGVASGQYTYIISADSTKMRRVGGNNELIIENGTRATTGVLVNYGNGRTRFSKPRINGDTLFVGVDTILGVGVASSYKFGVSGEDASASQQRYFDGGANSFSLVNLGATQIRTTSSSPMRLSASNGTDSSFIDIRRFGTATTYVDIQSIRTSRIGRVLIGGALLGGVGLTSTNPSVSLQSLTVQGDINLFNQITTRGRSNQIHLWEDSIFIRPTVGLLYVDSLNYTLSTTGKKIMLRDTATGLVQNIDPSLLVTATPTWQQTLTAGSALTLLNNIDIGALDLRFSSTNGGIALFINDDVGNIVMGFRKDDDVANRLQVQADGHMEWGDGTGAIDVGMTRVGPGILSMSGATGIDTRFHIYTDGTDSAIFSLGQDETVAKSRIYYDNNSSRFGIITGGNMFIHGLTNVSTQDRIIGQRASTGEVGYVTIGTGLDLTAGVLTATGGGGGSPAGNYGNIQINRDGAFASPGSDSLDWTNRLEFNFNGTHIASSGGMTLGSSGGTGQANWAMGNGGIDISASGSFFNAGGNSIASVQAGGMTINPGTGYTAPAASAVLDLTSTTKGLLLPRMTATQGSAISSPADGLMIYVTDTNGTFTSVGFWGRVAGVWTALHL